jgi:MscS family membrane protein
MFFNNSLQSWLIALAIFGGSVIASRILYFISTKILKRLFSKLRGRLAYIVTDMLEEPAAMLVVMAGFFWAQRRLSFDEAVDATISKIMFFLSILVVTWAVERLLKDLIDQYLVPLTERSASKLDDQLMPILRKAASFIIWALGIIIALDNVGYNVGTIIAGLGIGGLAFAFAAQETIANVFGGLTVFFDAPFRIGDRIKIAGYEGWVRELGLRSARLETLDGRRLTMPNSLFSKNVIENVSSEPATRALETVGLACDQDADTIERAIELIRGVMANSAGLEEKSTAWFRDVGDSSWNLQIVLWIKKDADYAGTISRFNVDMVRALGNAKIAFSLPVRMIVNESGNP